MKTRLALLLTPFALQVERSAPTRPAPVPCVPAEPMPVVGLHDLSADPMPVLRPDSTWRSAMPVHVRVPCYLADSLRAGSRRAVPPE